MKLAEFNARPLAEKINYINGFVDPSAKRGVANALVFENYSIFIICSIGGEILSVDAHAHSDDEASDAKKLLKGEVAIAIDCSGLPGTKEEIYKKVIRGTNRNN